VCTDIGDLDHPCAWSDLPDCDIRGTAFMQMAMVSGPPEFAVIGPVASHWSPRFEVLDQCQQPSTYRRRELPLGSEYLRMQHDCP
jgi:hypothetical protein